MTDRHDLTFLDSSQPLGPADAQLRAVVRSRGRRRVRTRAALATTPVVAIAAVVAVLVAGAGGSKQASITPIASPTTPVSTPVSTPMNTPATTTASTPRSSSSSAARPAPTYSLAEGSGPGVGADVPYVDANGARVTVHGADGVDNTHGEVTVSLRAGSKILHVGHDAFQSVDAAGVEQACSLPTSFQGNFILYPGDAISFSVVCTYGPRDASPPAPIVVSYVVNGQVVASWRG